MANRIGLCPNRGGCQNNYSRTPISIPEGADFRCPLCQTPLTDVTPKSSFSFIWVLALLAAVLCAALLAYVGFKLVEPNDQVQVQDGNPTPTTTRPNETPQPVAANPCKGMPMHRNVWADIKNRKYLIMGVQASAPPMNDSEEGTEWVKAEVKKGGVDEDERRRRELHWERTGFDYELAKMLASEMGLIKPGSVKAREVKEFKDLFCLLNRQEKDGSFSVDMIMSGIARDSVYDDTISWSKPYAKFGYSLVTKKSSPILSLADCKGKKIGIVSGDNIAKTYVTTHIENARLVELSDEEDEWLSNALNLSGGVDAVVYDYPFAVEELKWINDLAREQGVPGKLLEIRVAKLPEADLNYSIGVPKDEHDLLAMLNDAIDKVTDERNPRYAELIREYFTSEDITPVPILPGERVYVVRAGDSLSKIAAAELGDMNLFAELGRINNIANIHIIHPGQRLKLPGAARPAPSPPGS